MRRTALLTLLTTLTACERYSCGEYTVNLPEGTFRSGEWCGLFGTYAYTFQDTQELQLLIVPNTRDDDVDALFVDKLIITEARLPDPGTYTGQTVDIASGLQAECGIAPEGAGRGSLRFEPAMEASVTFLNESDRTLVGTRSLRMEWDITCPSSTVVGTDWVDVDDLATEP